MDSKKPIIYKAGEEVYPGVQCKVCLSMDYENCHGFSKPSQQASQPQWSPIESAPSDEFILMYLPLAHGDYEIHLLTITEYGLVDMFNDVTTYGIDDFTHWMPLPEPPKEREK